MQVNQFPNEAVELAADDYFGVAVKSGDSYKTKKVKAANALKEYVYTATTTDDAVTEMLVDGARVVIPTDTAWAFSILLLSWDGTFSGVWKIEGGIENRSGTVGLARNWSATNSNYNTNSQFDATKISGYGVTTTVLAGDTSNTFGHPVVDADTDNNSLRIRVTATPYTSREFRWKARVRFVELTV